jgi:hypothetical protein
MEIQREIRMKSGSETPSEEAIREASDFFEHVLKRPGRAHFTECWALAERFDIFQRCGGFPEKTAPVAPEQPILRDVLRHPSPTGVQQVPVELYTTDAPYPASNAEVQFYRHGQDDTAPGALHLVFTTMHFTQQQGEQWVTEVLRNYRPQKKKPLTVQDLEFLGFIERHRPQFDLDQMCQQWNTTYPKKSYRPDYFKKHWKRLQERLRPPGVLVCAQFQHLPVLLMRQAEDVYMASVLLAGPKVTATTPDQALTAVLHAAGENKQTE